ncbi:MAG: hypothetical protein FJX56_09550 [Alphaproteobacteria bacterium]|nr:hypothetical protein [Alphaproteobacteria bacterium]
MSLAERRQGDKRRRPAATQRALAAAVFAVLLSGLLWGAASSDSGLPVPRFVSLAAEKVNLRTGPGARYPIAWVFVRRGLPVEVVAEFDLWRQIVDSDGVKGWVHRAMLSGERTALVIDGVQAFRTHADDAAPVAFRAEPGVLGALRGCRGVWCQLEVAGHRGWTRRTNLWGVYPREEVR